MKLNLACGYRRMEGYVNLDKFEGSAADYIVDLEQTPWAGYAPGENVLGVAPPPPWSLEDSSVTEVILHHALEHIGETTAAFERFMRELYRVCAPGAQIHITVPHWRSDDFWSDPTHVRVITPQLLTLFSKANCAIWKEQGAANTPIAVMWDIDFKVLATSYRPRAALAEMLKNGQINEADFREQGEGYWNIYSEFIALLEAVK